MSDATGYTGPQGALPFSDEELERLHRRFQHDMPLLPIHPQPNRERLHTQLNQMITFARIQPRGQLPRLLRYPVFAAYAEVLLGRNPEKFLRFLSMPEPLSLPLAEQRTWTEYRCWSMLQVTVCKHLRRYDDKQKEFIEYQIVCEIETENEEQVGVENTWCVLKRYSDIRNLYLQLKKLRPEFGDYTFPGRTFLPGRATSQPVIDERLTQFDDFLRDVINWVKEKVAQIPVLSPPRGEPTEGIGEEAMHPDEVLSKIIGVLDEFLEVTQLDRKPPCKNDKLYSCNMLHTGWFSSVLHSKDIHTFYSGYSTLNCEILGLLVEHNDNIRTVDLSSGSGGSLRNEGFRCLLQALAANKCGVQDLYIGGYQGHNCDNEDVETFCAANKTLQSLYITGGISVSVDEPLWGFASRIPTLRVLDLSRCFRKHPKAAQAMINLTPHLKTHKHLEELYLNENHIGNRGAELMGEALADNTILKVLSMRTCKVGPSGLINIFKGVAQNKTLERLYVTDRPSTLAVGAPSSEKVAEAVVHMLQDNDRLEELDLARQYLGNHCEEIVRALASAPALKRLNLRNNRMVAAPVLVEFLKHNQSVTAFDISHNDLVDPEDSQTHTTEWAELLKQEQRLQVFGVPWLDDGEASRLMIESLAENRAIQQLEFSSAIACVKELNQFFLTNETVKSIINLQSPPKGLFSMHLSIASHKSLEHLHWNELDAVEAKKFLRHLAEAPRPIRFTFVLESPECQMEILQSYQEICAARS